MRYCIIKQPIGLGDIFFSQKIASSLIEQGFVVIWPVPESAMYLNHYMVNDGVQYIDISSDFLLKTQFLDTTPGSINYIDNNVILSLDGCYSPPAGVMRSKYKLVNLEFNDWLKFFNYRRNLNKENELYYDILSLQDHTSYRFINNKIGSPGYESLWDIPSSNIIDNIYLEKKEGFTIFDWCKVIENASEFYVMETSVTYLIEKLHTVATDYNMFCRNNIGTPDFMDYINIYTHKPWTFFDCNKAKYSI